MRVTLDHMFSDTEDDIPFAGPKDAHDYISKLFTPQIIQCHCPETGDTMSFMVDHTIEDD